MLRQAISVVVKTPALSFPVTDQTEDHVTSLGGHLSRAPAPIVGW